MGGNRKLLLSIGGILFCCRQILPVHADALTSALPAVPPKPEQSMGTTGGAAASTATAQSIGGARSAGPLPGLHSPTGIFSDAGAAPKSPAFADVAMVAAAAVSGARQAAERDYLLTRLSHLSSPDWNRDQVQTFINSAGGYGTVNGASVPVPGTLSPALLQEYGCTHVLVQNFHRTQRNVQLVIYTFVGPEGAYGAYSVMRDGASTVIVRGGASSETDCSVSFWQGRRFVVASSASEDDEVSKALVSSLADQMSALIRERADLPGLLTSLSGLYRVQGSEKFFMGSAAARRFSPMPHIVSLSIERSLGAAFVEYHFPSPQPDRMKSLLVDYPSAELARSVFSTYSATLSEGHKSWLVQPDRLLCKLDEGYALCTLSGTKLLVLTGAKHKDTPLLLVRQLMY